VTLKIEIRITSHSPCEFMHNMYLDRPGTIFLTLTACDYLYSRVHSKRSVSFDISRKPHAISS